jgi:hypothetical protein
MTPVTKERIATEKDYIRVLCDRVALRFKNPTRLRVIRDEEERAAKRLCDAGYKLARLLSVMEWAHKESDFDGWRKVLTSVSGLAKYLLEPRNVTDCLESRYDVWLASHPPMCSHGRLVENKTSCPGCNADPSCVTCHGTGETVERVAERKDKQFICDCAAPKMGLPPLQEQISYAAEQYWLKRKKPAEPEDDEVL